MTGTVIVGASVGGVRVAQGLRAAGYRLPIMFVDSDADAPYDKPPLSKGVLGPGAATAPPLVESGLGELGVVRSGVAAVALDQDRRMLTLADGERVPFRSLLIATGSRPRTLGLGPPGAVHYLRTFADARGLHDALGRARRLVVIGGGFIGTEVASTARARGLEVTIVEAGPGLLSLALPAAAARPLADLHWAAGIALLFDQRVTDIDSDGQHRVVVLNDGQHLTCDLVVAGIGAVPATSWLADSGLTLDDGVMCSESLLAFTDSPIDPVGDVGDVARWWNPAYRRPMRLEHWSAARKHAAVVAANIAPGASNQVASLIPYVWSDQLDVHIQQVGDDDLQDVDVELTRAGSSCNGRLFRYLRDWRLVGATGFDAQRDIALIRRNLNSAQLSVINSAPS